MGAFGRLGRRFRDAYGFDRFIFFLYVPTMKKLILSALGAIGLIAVFSRLGWTFTAMLDGFNVIASDASRIPTEFFIVISYLVFMALAGLFYHFVID